MLQEARWSSTNTFCMDLPEHIAAARNQLRLKFQNALKPESKMLMHKVGRSQKGPNKRNVGVLPESNEKMVLQCLKRFGVAPVHDIEVVTFEGSGQETSRTFVRPKVSTVLHAGVYVVSPSV